MYSKYIHTKNNVYSLYELILYNYIMSKDYNILIVGAGLSGCTIANKFSLSDHNKITIIDKRDHIAGNCYDYIDKHTGVRMCKYGAHIFHTNSEKVWEFVQQFSKWVKYEHKVISRIDEDVFVPIPVNIDTINILENQQLETIEEQKEWLKNNTVKYNDIPKNSEEMSMSLIGKNLHNILIKDYTFKQWNKECNELSPDVLKRIPINYGHDDRYFKDKYQGLPENGYTTLCENMINNENIKLYLNTDYETFKNNSSINFDIIIFTGAIDQYFKDLPKLEYRSIDFVNEIHETDFFQKNSVVNYPSKDYPWTRIVEHKHFPNQPSHVHQHDSHIPYISHISHIPHISHIQHIPHIPYIPYTIITKEFTNDNGDPYYPVLNDKNINLYEKYKKLASEEESKNVYFLGRLAEYKYFNMDQAIENSLNFYEKIIVLYPHNNLYKHISS